MNSRLTAVSTATNHPALAARIFEISFTLRSLLVTTARNPNRYGDFPKLSFHAYALQTASTPPRAVFIRNRHKQPQPNITLC